MDNTERLSKWSKPNINCYKSTTEGGKTILTHRQVWIRYNNIPIPIGYVIHHINGDKKDNRIENLKLVSNKEHKDLHRK